MPPDRPGDTGIPTVALVCGARPNFVKIAPLCRAFASHPERCRTRIIHTGQHYSPGLSDVFFRELEMPSPDLHLDVGSGSHGEQTAAALIGIERYLTCNRPQLMICVGDVNSTLAAALAAAKSGVTSAHVEAGLRSGDRSMPEEINRIVADHVCDWLYTTTEEAGVNLHREGIDATRVVFAGNVMIDTLNHQLPRLDMPGPLRRLGLTAGSYVLLTMHRPANVDNPAGAQLIVETIRRVAENYRVVFPMHPRAHNRLNEHFGTDQWPETVGGYGLHACDPLGYGDFIALQKHAFAVLTDSGGVQEETTALGVPCLTLRPNTERQITVTAGTNTLVGLDPDRIIAVLDRIPVCTSPVRANAQLPHLPLWDGHAAERIVEHVLTYVLADGMLPGAGEHDTHDRRLVLRRPPEKRTDVRRITPFKPVRHRIEFATTNAP